MEFGDDPETPATRAASGARGHVHRFRDTPDAPRPDPALAQIRAYWEALRAGRVVPMRSQVNPRGLENALDRAVMLERVADGIARIRLAGSHATALMGMEVRGMPLSALVHPESRDDLAQALKAAFDTPAVVEITLEARRGLGRPALSGRMVILPLMSEDGRVDRALGYLGAEGVIGRTPRRFDITLTRLTRLHSDSADQAESRGHHTLPDRVQPAPGFAEPGAGFDPAPAPAARPGRPYLRLVKTDRC